MSVSFQIQDGKGKPFNAEVTPEKELVTTSRGYPPSGKQKVKIFRQYFTTTGASSGSNDMGVNGAVTNVDFYIPASQENDRYITTVSILVGYGTTGQPNQWADATAVSNGTRFFYSTTTENIDIHDGIKTNQDMFRLSDNVIQTDWEVRHVNAANDFGYFITVPLSTYLPPFGVKLDAGSGQKITFRVRDDVTNADSFNAIGLGFERFA